MVRKKFLKHGCMFIFPCFVLIVLSSCGQEAPPDEIEIKGTFNENFLSEITELYIDNHVSELKVKSVEIKERQTDGRTDVAACEIELNNLFYDCKIAASLTYEYHNSEGWVLEDWKIEDKKITPKVDDVLMDETLADALSFYGAEVIGELTDLTAEIPTIAHTYKISDTILSVGTTGVQIRTGGIVRIVYSFVELETGVYTWDKQCDLSLFKRDYANYQGTWYEDGERWADRGSIASLILQDITQKDLDADVLDITIQYFEDTLTNKNFVIDLLQCTPLTKINDIISEENCFVDSSIDFSAICFSYGYFEYPKTDSVPYKGCVMLTSDGLYCFALGEDITDLDGETHVHYNSVHKFK